MSSLKKLFPTLIWNRKLPGVSGSLKKQLLLETKVFEAEDLVGQKWSQKNYPFGYTSYGSRSRLHDYSPTFLELSQLLDKEVSLYFKKLKFEWDQNPLTLSSLWVNVMRPGAHHSWHIHPRSVISGTFYLQAASDSAAIKFADPRQTLFMHLPPRKSSLERSLNRSKLNKTNKTPRSQKLSQGADASFVPLSVSSGDVVLFESWLSHEVPCHLGKSPRISVSFNYDSL